MKTFPPASGLQVAQGFAAIVVFWAALLLLALFAHRSRSWRVVFLRRVAWGGAAALLCMVAMYALCYALTGALDPRLWPVHIHDLGIGLGLCVGLVAGIFTGCKYEPR